MVKKYDLHRNLQRVAQRANPDWMDCAWRALLDVARANEIFTALTVQRELKQYNVRTPSKRAMGPVIRQAQRQRLITFIDDFVRHPRNSQPIRQWRSTIFIGRG